jgi:hypothetical protein
MNNITVEFFNLPYFIFIAIAVGLILGLYFLLKNRTMKTKKIVIFSILLLNLAIHFLKLTFPPYSNNPGDAMEKIWFINICAVSVLSFPLFFLSKSDALKDFMFYLGVISGTLAMVIPTEALGEAVWQLDLFRFYIAHMIILIAPLLMVLLKVHKLDYKRIWKMPFIMCAVLMFIMVQQIIQSELGIIDLRNADFSDINYPNPSLIWGPGDSDLAMLFTIFTPNFFKVVPFGEFAGQIKYWPFIWLVFPMLFYFIVLPILICLPWELRHIIKDTKNLFGKTKILFKN